MTEIQADPEAMTINALKGQFGGVTYFLTTMTLPNCAEHLHFEKTSETTFSERVQRRLNEKRAELIYTDYLKSGGTRFFNSLVVVIRPRKNDHDHGFYEFIPHKVNGRSLKTGNLKILNDIERIVVDGQHRLFALSEAYKDVKQPDYQDEFGLKDIEIPVVFLTFDSIGGEGFSKEISDLSSKITEQTRLVFTALNKNAKNADKNSLLILDDNDFPAVCARTLLETNEKLELFTKWSDSGTSLKEADIYFTTIDTIKFFCDALIEGEESEIQSKYDLPIKEEREKALGEYFISSQNSLSGDSPKDIIEHFYTNVEFYKNWRKNISDIFEEGIPKQPIKAKLSKDQKEIVANLRNSSLLSTVAGQKMLFQTIKEFKQLEKYGDSYREAFTNITNKLAESGIMKKSYDLWKDVLVASNGKMLPKNVYIASQLLSRVLNNSTDKSFDDWWKDESYNSGLGHKNTSDFFKQAKKDFHK